MVNFTIHIYLLFHENLDLPLRTRSYFQKKAILKKYTIHCHCKDKIQSIFGKLFVLVLKNKERNHKATVKYKTVIVNGHLLFIHKPLVFVTLSLFLSHHASTYLFLCLLLSYWPVPLEMMVSL